MGVLDRVVLGPSDEGPLKVMIYGEPGAGKSVFACGAGMPEAEAAAFASQVLFLDTESGQRSLRNHPEIAPYVTRLRMKSIQDIEDIALELRDPKTLSHIRWVVLDTISEFQKRHLDDLLRKAAKNDRNRNPYLPFQGDYKENTEYLRRLVLTFRELDRNICIVAHDTEVKDEGTGAIMVRPAVTDKLCKTLVGNMDLIAYMARSEDVKTKESYRTLQVHPSRRVQCKTRLYFDEAVLKNPTFGDIIFADSRGKLAEEVNSFTFNDDENDQDGLALVQPVNGE